MTDWFELLFPAFMIALPALASLWVRANERAAIDRAALRRARIGLWIATVATLAVFAVLHWLRRSGRLAFWSDIPWWMTWGMPPDRILWVAFFPLWFVGFQRVLLRARPAAASPYPTAHAQRTAGLRVRSVESPIRARHWLWGWLALLGAGVVAVVGLVSGGAHGADRTLLVALTLPFAALPLALGPFTVRALLREPEPLDPTGSEELRQAYARLRAAKVRGMFGLCLAMTLLFAGIPALAAWQALDGAVLGWIGGIGGCLVGFGGAAFGVRMGMLRLRIKERLDELVARSDTMPRP